MRLILNIDQLSDYSRYTRCVLWLWYNNNQVWNATLQSATQRNNDVDSLHHMNIQSFRRRLTVESNGMIKCYDQWSCSLFAFYLREFINNHFCNGNQSWNIKKCIYHFKKAFIFLFEIKIQLYFIYVSS